MFSFIGVYFFCVFLVTQAVDENLEHRDSENLDFSNNEIFVWQLFGSILLIVCFVVVCSVICHCYKHGHCRKSEEVTNLQRCDSNDVARRRLSVKNIQRFPPSVPPPPYDVAILMPPVVTNSRVPTYEEVTSRDKY